MTIQELFRGYCFLNNGERNAARKLNVYYPTFKNIVWGKAICNVQKLDKVMLEVIGKSYTHYIMGLRVSELVEHNFGKCHSLHNNKKWEGLPHRGLLEKCLELHDYAFEYNEKLVGDSEEILEEHCESFKSGRKHSLALLEHFKRKGGMIALANHKDFNMRMMRGYSQIPSSVINFVTDQLGWMRMEDIWQALNEAGLTEGRKSTDNMVKHCYPWLVTRY